MIISMSSLAERLRSHVEKLARTPRMPGSPEHLAAAEHIRAHLQEAGFSVQRERFQGPERFGTNLLTQPLPENEALPLLVIGAHYDSVPGSPGADDNASAVAALLEVARWLGPRVPSATGVRIQLVAYDLEEYGMIGSYVHSLALKQAAMHLLGMISLEMLGYTDQRPGSQRLPTHLVGRYPDVGNFIGVVGNETSRVLLQTFTQAMKTVPGLPVEYIAVPGNGEVLPETRLSDHSAFWDQGYPALMITDTSFYRNPHYHQSSDIPATLDFPFLTKVTVGVQAALGRLLAP